MARREKPVFLNDPQWYKDAVIYQVHVKSFYDANNDGIGDNESPQVDPQAGVVNSVIETGLKGGGCSVSTGSAFDPMLLLMGIFAGLGLFRRKSQQVRSD